MKQILNCDFVGEETGWELSGHPFSWVVDPNDGTADFLERRPGSAISIGLLHNATPVLGVVFAPVTPRGPDCIAWAEGVPALLRNGRPVNNDLQSVRLAPGTVVMVSYGATQKAKLNALLCQPAIFHPMPSIAYRLARVAAGDGVAAVSLYSVSPHDLVAGHALLCAVNGDVWNEKGEPVRYASPRGAVGVLDEDRIKFRLTDPVVVRCRLDCAGGAGSQKCESQNSYPHRSLYTHRFSVSTHF